MSARRVGEIAAADLAAVSLLQGLEGPPYPFVQVGGDRRGPSDAAERLRGGDLHPFLAWARAYATADIWVACRVHHDDPSTPGRRLLAYRTGDAGYVAVQRGDGVTGGSVEVFETSPSGVAAALADAVGLTTPGSLPEVVVPGYVGYFAPAPPEDDDEDADDVAAVRVSVGRAGTPSRPRVADDAVTSVATIQSRWQPPRRWGVDWTKAFVAVVGLAGDGDYVYAPGFGHAVPVDTAVLAARIDALIADDLAMLRRARGRTD